jgi:hypothetical protein
MLIRLMAVAAGVLVASGVAWAQGTGDLEGTWTLVSSVVEREGKEIDQFGPGVKGMMSLDVHGRFMFTIIGAGLPKFASNNRANGTPEENKAVVSQSIAVFGTYFVEYTSNTLVFKIESATFPNWDSSEQRRSIVTSGTRELKYVTAQASSGGRGIVTWKRAD